MELAERWARQGGQEPQREAPTIGTTKTRRKKKKKKKKKALTTTNPRGPSHPRET